ncbi:hypothetical protein [Sulfolobus super-elliptical virus]|nr:hypothetical protein [Sulfolobus super-elliptical virus]
MKNDLIRLMKKSYEENGFISVYVSGFQGAGKTTYAVLRTIQLLQEFFKTEEELKDYFKMIYVQNLQDLVRLFKEYLKKKERYYVVILDDPASWISKWQNVQARKDIVQFNEIFTLMRSITANIFLTTVSDEVTKGIRERFRFKAYITPLKGDISYVELWKLMIKHSTDEHYYKKVGEGKFIRRMPDWAYDFITQKREITVDEMLQKYLQTVENKTMIEVTNSGTEVEDVLFSKQNDYCSKFIALRNQIETFVKSGYTKREIISIMRKQGFSFDTQKFLKCLKEWGL